MPTVREDVLKRVKVTKKEKRGDYALLLAIVNDADKLDAMGTVYCLLLLLLLYSFKSCDISSGAIVALFIGDGFVEANPDNTSYTTKTVSGGETTLDKAYSLIHVGLPYTSDLQTLDIDTNDGETLMDKKKLVGEVTISLEESSRCSPESI